jgi:predicted transcriptional regulator
VVTAVRSSQGIKPILSIMSLAEIQEAIEKLGSEERAELWTWFQEVEETDELLAAVDEGIQAAEEGRVFSLEEIKTHRGERPFSQPTHFPEFALCRFRGKLPCLSALQPRFVLTGGCTESQCGSFRYRSSAAGAPLGGNADSNWERKETTRL